MTMGTASRAGGGGRGAGGVEKLQCRDSSRREGGRRWLGESTDSAGDMTLADKIFVLISKYN
jgi:hypothetical protein